LITVGLTL